MKRQTSQSAIKLKSWLVTLIRKKTTFDFEKKLTVGHCGQLVVIKLLINCWLICSRQECPKWLRGFVAENLGSLPWGKELSCQNSARYPNPNHSKMNFLSWTVTYQESSILFSCACTYLRVLELWEQCKQHMKGMDSVVMYRDVKDSCQWQRSKKRPFHWNINLPTLGSTIITLF